MNIRKFSQQESRSKSRRSCLLADNSRVCLRANKRKQILFIDVVTKQNKQSTFFIVEAFQMQMYRFCWLVLKGSELATSLERTQLNTRWSRNRKHLSSGFLFGRFQTGVTFIMYKKTKENMYLDSAQRNSPINLIRTLAIFSKLL